MSINKKVYGLNQDEELFEISESILGLSDELSEEIVLMNIKEQMEGPTNVFASRINYVTLFRDRYGSVTDSSAYYDKEYLRNSLLRVSELVGELMGSKYGVKLASDLDFYMPDTFLKDMETAYEFFFIRHFDNLVRYFYAELVRNRVKLAKKYAEILDKGENSKDIFVIQSEKKYKNPSDVVIMHYMNDIIDEIRDSVESASVLFDKILKEDPLEEFNVRTQDMLLNYGKTITFNGDRLCYDLYMKPLQEQETKNELKNAIMMKYKEQFAELEA
jgi:hypothetical protein